MTANFLHFDALMESRDSSSDGSFGDGFPDSRPVGVHPDLWEIAVASRRREANRRRIEEQNRARQERINEQREAFRKSAEADLDQVEEEIRRKHLPEWVLNGGQPPSDVDELRAELRQEKVSAEISDLYAREDRLTQVCRIADHRMQQLREGMKPPGTLPPLEEDED